MGQHLARVTLGQASSFLGMTLLIWLVTAAINVVLGKLLVFGFAKRLNIELGNAVFYKFGRYNNDETLTFIGIVVVPMTLHYLTVLFGANMQAKAARQRLGGPEMEYDQH
jgi:hypothetical protein